MPRSAFPPSLLDALDQPKGFDPYFPDIIYARDVIDPPVRSHRRNASNLSLVVDHAEYDSRTHIEIDDRRLIVSFGIHGLSEISESFSDISVDADEHEAERLTIDGIRFALIFQASQGFINNRLTVDGNFTERFLAHTPAVPRSRVIYERMSPVFPNTEKHPQADPATQYRVCKIATRIALDRLVTVPYSTSLSEAQNAGGLILKCLQDRYKDELESIGSAIDAAESDAHLVWMAMRLLETNDHTPLMWAALADPAKRGVVSAVALAHIGPKVTPQPGWVSIV